MKIMPVIGQYYCQNPETLLISLGFY